VGVALLFGLLCACATMAAPSSVPHVTNVSRIGIDVDVTGRPRATGKIQHVIIIVQENRSFDNLFAGYPGADTQAYGYTSTGKKIKLAPIGLKTNWDINHVSYAFFQACDGQGSVPGTDCKMDGFDREAVKCGHPFEPPCPNKHPQYAYVPRNETQPYFAMANSYVLGDRMFESDLDASSFVSHQYIIAGQASSSVNYPTSVWGCDGGPSDTIATLLQNRQIGPPITACFDNQTLGDELDAAGLSWAYYTASLKSGDGIWSAYQAISHIRYGSDWKNVVSPQTKFFDAVAKGNLPAVSWVTPTCANSDHAGCASATGPDWVASLVNAVGESPYWSTSAIFIFWDDYGGWYDHVAPAMVDYDGLGFRVPLLIVSPYAKKQYVSHLQYEHGSILRFVEDQFGLARLAPSDSRANSPEGDSFDFSHPPRKFVAIPSTLKVRDFRRETLDQRIPDAE
jgi:phospholipase C